MKPNVIKSVIAAAVCLASLHSQAQNVASLNVELKGKAHPAWSNPRLTQTNPDQQLKDIYSRTTQYLKSPNRVQKMGGMDGGGGNALLCEENGKITAELLDVYEAKSLGIQLELGGKTEMLDILDYTFDRLAKVSPLRSAVYRAMARDLLSKDTQWVSNKQMPVIDDVNLATIPQDCLLVQVAIQRPLNQKNLPNAKTYIIDSEMFNLLDETSKAALVLHEVLYREARHSEIDNSLFTRHLVGLIMSASLPKYNIQNLNDIYKKNDILCLESNDTPTWEKVRNDLDSCAFIKDTDYNVSFSKFVYYQNLPVPFTLQEKWLGKTGKRLSYISYHGSQTEINNLTAQFDNDAKNYALENTIELNGSFNLSAKFSDSELIKSPSIFIKNGKISTTLPLKSFRRDILRTIPISKISPYTSSGLNYITSKDFISNDKNLVETIQRKFLHAETLTFPDKKIRIQDEKDCTSDNEGCHQSIIMALDSNKKAFTLSGLISQIQIFHPAAISLNVNKERITSDGWVSANQVWFNADGSISEYEVNNSKTADPTAPPEIIKVKY